MKKKYNLLSNYIKVYDNILSNNECNLILDEYEKCNEWKNASVGIIENGTVNETVRNCKVIPISIQTTINLNFEKRKKIDDLVFKKAGDILQKYTKEFKNCGILEDSGYDLLKYEVGGKYLQHTDHMTKNPRTISVSFLLNDDFEGGEFAFFDRDIVISPKIGSVIVFPSNFLYPHEIIPVTKGTRYSIITWFR